MFDDDQSSDREEVEFEFARFDEQPESRTQRRHSDDPFACPCCANVFSETIRLANLDLLDHSRELLPAEPRRCAPTVLVSNARIITMNPAAPNADCLLTKGGKIEWIGREQDLPSAIPADAERLDMKGKVVLPGFVEPHMHLAPLAMLHSFENVGPFRYATISGAIERLAQLAETTKPGDWIVGRQFDPSLQDGPDALTCDMLDQASTTHPIFVYNASLPIAYANSLALEIAGIDADTVVPAGSELGRDEFGEPNGVLKGGPAMAMVGSRNPVLRSQNLAEACIGVFESANAVGITTLCDQGTGLFQGVRELDLYRGLRESERMTARFRYCVSQALADRWDETDIAWGQGDQWLRLTG